MKQTVCPRCKKPVPAATVFCDYCGARVAHPPSCSLCGTLLEPGSRFCPSCGTPVSEGQEKPGAGPGPLKERPATAIYPQEDERESVPQNTERAARVDEQKFGEMPGNSPPPIIYGEPVGHNTDLHENRSAMTIVTESDGGVQPASCRVPLSWISSHKSLIAILIMIVIIAGVATINSIPVLAPFGSPMSTGNETVLSSNVMQPVPDTSDVSGPEQVTADATIASPVFSPLPGPTQVPPGNLLVYLQVERDPFTNIVSVLFMGGKGQAGVQDVVVRRTRSDGLVITGTFKPLQTGSGVELQGTEKTDRVEVTVHYYTGDVYTVINQTFEYKKLI
jgi:RNA polymerase subunit RPABC4/transcription elongation factor Spt4